MSTSVEDAVEVDRVELPSCCYCCHVLVQPRDEGDMTGSGFGGDASMGDAESAMFEDSRAEERRHWGGILRCRIVCRP